MEVINSFRNPDASVVDKTIKYLGIERGISGGFKKYEVLQPWLGSSKSVFLFGLSWEPPDGYIVMLDDEGKVLSKAKTGYIKSIGLHESDGLDSIDLVVVDATVGYGSGFREDKFQIYSIRGDSLEKIWEGVSYLQDVMFQSKTVEGSISFEIGSDNVDYVLKYDTRTRKYSFNTKTRTWSEHKLEHQSQKYVLEDGKFVNMPNSSSATGERTKRGKKQTEKARRR
ncbi:MAG: hypothetical protein V1736_13740 [Pseudomonadota bacterium]